MMSYRPTLIVFAAMLLISCACPSHGAEWTRFRGPNGTGLVADAPIPVRWTEEDYNWKIELPGLGHSSPVIFGDRIFLTSAQEDDSRRLVHCFRASDGELLWRRDFELTPHRLHKRNSFASATPAVDEQHVYLSWTDPEQYTLMALDHDGNPVWRRDLGTFQSQHGGGTSPIVYGDLVIIGNDQDGESSLLAVDRLTGKDRWRAARSVSRTAYSTPCIYRPEGGADELIFNSGAHGISSIDPQTGTTHWELAVFDKRSVSSPILAGGLLFGSCGSGAGGNYVAAIRPGDTEANVAPELEYKIDRSAPYVSTPIAKDGLLFLFGDKGVVSCVHARSGELLWRERVSVGFSGSPVCVGERLYCIAEDGEVVVLAASDTFELLARNPLGDPSRATPAIADGVMYLRTYSYLISIGGEGAAGD